MKIQLRAILLVALLRNNLNAYFGPSGLFFVAENATDSYAVKESDGHQLVSGGGSRGYWGFVQLYEIA